MENKITIEGAVPLRPGMRFAHPVDWVIGRGENWVIAGGNGAGKSILADLLMRRVALKEGHVDVNTRDGRSAYEAVKSIGFRDIYSVVDCSEAYYQQRWNADAREATPLAVSLFTDAEIKASRSYFERFSLAAALEKRIVSLSSGELRKLLVIRALAAAPEVLVIDNPFVGLDALSREELSAMLGQLSADGVIQFILLVSDPRDVTEWSHMVLPVTGMTLGDPVPAPAFISGGWKELFPEPDIPDVPAALPDPGNDYRLFARLEDVTVRYGNKTILEAVNWTVERGEKWALLGANGSGKSTLLSLLYGDNPQAYANRITLFDRRRGSGESIWDIKRRIGYLNSDLHSFYLKDITAREVVLSGFYDTVGIYSAANPEQQREAALWLDTFGAAHLAHRRFTELSFGEQRLVMLSRTFVKRPWVLILDEPMHGLDRTARRRASLIIERYCSRPHVTLVFVTHYRGEVPACVDKVKSL